MTTKQLISVVASKVQAPATEQADQSPSAYSAPQVFTVGKATELVQGSVYNANYYDGYNRYMRSWY